MSKEWESAYQSGKHNNNWPYSDLISLFYRFQKAEREGSYQWTKNSETFCL